MIVQYVLAGKSVSSFSTVFNFLQKSFFDFRLFEWDDRKLYFFAFQEVQILFPFGEEGEEREDLVSKEADEGRVFREFGFDGDFGPTED